MDFNDVANATLDIGGFSANNHWISFGSGFHFSDEAYVATNYHVVKPLVEQGAEIYVRNEVDERIPASLTNHSDLEENGGNDWAVLELQDHFSREGFVLMPGEDSINRGKTVVFAGFPHGVGHGDVPDLLVQSANIAGDYGSQGFYLDGSVNKGNSGGPIVDLESEAVIGYTTFKRYVEHSTIGDVMNQWEQLHVAVRDADEVFSVGNLGYFDVLTEMTRSFLLLRDTIETNANTGIGIGFKISCIDEL